jgi:hypothetical protein
MKLVHLDYAACPSCGIHVRSELSSDRHSNGHWNEEVRFACGSVITWSPNLFKEWVSYPCPSKEPKPVIGAIYLDLEKTRRIMVSQLIPFDPEAHPRYDRQKAIIVCVDYDDKDGARFCMDHSDLVSTMTGALGGRTYRYKQEIKT